MRRRLALLHIPIEWPFYREDLHELVGAMAIAAPNRPWIQCNAGELLEYNMGYFFDLLVQLSELLPRKED